MSVTFHNGSGQIQSSSSPRYEGAFLNIYDKEEYIGVWGHAWKHPTILITNKNHFDLLSFDSLAFYQEWKEKHTPASIYERIIIVGGIDSD